MKIITLRCICPNNLTDFELFVVKRHLQMTTKRGKLFAEVMKLNELHKRNSKKQENKSQRVGGNVGIKPFIYSIY